MGTLDSVFNPNRTVTADDSEYTFSVNSSAFSNENGIVHEIYKEVEVKTEDIIRLGEVIDLIKESEENVVIKSISKERSFTNFAVSFLTFRTKKLRLKKMQLKRHKATAKPISSLN